MSDHNKYFLNSSFTPPRCGRVVSADEAHLVQPIGGTGTEFGHFLSEEVCRTDASSNMRIAYLDIDPDGLENVPQDDQYLMNHVPANDLLDQIEKKPESFPGHQILGDPDRLWQDLGGSDDLVRGAQTVRKLGVMALLFHLWRYFAELSSFLVRPIRELHRYKDNKVHCWSGNGHSGSTGRQRLTITQAFSACGGTGSGIALLMADLMHHLLRSHWGIRRYQIDADILLPGIMLHSADDPQALMANTWAFFLELSSRFKDRMPPLQLGPVCISRARRPYGQVYLYDDMNVRGKRYSSRREVVQVMAETFKLRNLGPTAPVYQARLVDIHLGYPNVFSSAGASILEFPAREILAQFGYRLGAKLIRDILLHTAPQEELEQKAQAELSDFLNQYPAFRELPDFRRDRAGKPLRVDMKRFQNLERNALPRAIENMAQHQEVNSTAVLDDLVSRSADDLEQAINQVIERMLNSPGGLLLGRQFLSTLDILLSQHRERLLQQVERSRQVLGRRQDEVERQRNQPWWQRLSLNPRASYLSRQQQFLEAALIQKQIMAQIKLVNQLRQHIEGHRMALGSWADGLVELEKRLVAMEADFVRDTQNRKSVVVESVICPDDIDRLYVEEVNAALAQARDGLEFRWMPDEGRFVLHYRVKDNVMGNDRVSILSPEGIERHVAFCRSFWTPVENLSVEQILVEQGRSPEEVLAHLAERGAPLVASDEVKQIPAERNLMILGTETGASGFFKDYVGKTGLNLVVTGDKHRIVFLSTVHGLNPFNLMQAASWEQAYNRAVANGKSVHVYPEFEGESAVEPAAQKTARPVANQAQMVEEMPTPDGATVKVEEAANVPVP